MTMTNRGSSGNVIAGLSSFFIPGLGQLLQGRLLAAAIHLILDVFLWIFLLGWIMHLYSAYNAAVFEPDPLDTFPQ